MSPNQHQPHQSHQNQHQQAQQAQQSSSAGGRARRKRRSTKREQRHSKAPHARGQGRPLRTSTVTSISGLESAKSNHQTAEPPSPPPPQSTDTNNNVSDDYKLLLSPMFSVMTKITDHIFLTGVSGMTKENFRRNHIDFVVNITTEAPFWEDVESMRLPLEDDASANILNYMDMAVDRMHEVITKRNAHVLVHCFAGVSRSATIVIAYLMKFKKMTLREAFNYCYSQRPVIKPNNGFMLQLINYELKLFGKNSTWMVDVDVESTIVRVPHFFLEEHPKLILLEVLAAKEKQKLVGSTTTTTGSTIATAPVASEPTSGYSKLTVSKTTSPQSQH